MGLGEGQRLLLGIEAAREPGIQWHFATQDLCVTRHDIAIQGSILVNTALITGRLEEQETLPTKTEDRHQARQKPNVHSAPELETSARSHAPSYTFVRCRNSLLYGAAFTLKEAFDPVPGHRESMKWGRYRVRTRRSLAHPGRESRLLRAADALRRPRET